MEDFKSEFFKFLLAADKEGALEFIDYWAKSNSYEKALLEIVEPALQKFGKKWARQEDVNLAQGYISAKIAEEVLLRVAKERKHSEIQKVTKGIAVVGNIENDFHALGRKMVYNFLLISGWEVYDLGNDVLAEEFVDKAVEVKASVIGASAMMYSNAINMLKIRNELDKRRLGGKIKFAVGGAIFNLRPKLVEEIKADGTAANAIEAIELFNTLNADLGVSK